MNKYKYEDLKKVMDKLEKHSQKGDVSISIDPRIGTLEISYTSNVDTQTVIEVFQSDLTKFVTIKEEKWL